MPCGSSSGSDAFVFTRLDTHWWCQDPSVLPHAASVVRGGPPDDNIAHESVSPCDIAKASPTLAASIVFRTAVGTQADHSQPERDSEYTLDDFTVNANLELARRRANQIGRRARRRPHAGGKAVALRRRRHG